MPADAIAVLAAARPERVRALLARLAGRDVELICTSRFDCARFNDIRQHVLPEDRFSASAGAPFRRRFPTVAIPYAHAHAERHAYRNVEECATALGATRVIRLFANELLVEEDAPTMTQLAQFHDRSAAQLAQRKAERLAELATFTGLPLAGLDQICVDALAGGFKLWRAADPRTAAAVTSFYRDNDFYLYQLSQANYYSGGRTEYLAALRTILTSGMSVLEFGFGVGEVILDLARFSCAATAVDINPRLVDFVKFKAARRGLALNAGLTLPDRKFDAIIALDVLEHLVDPENTLAELAAHLHGPRLLIIRLPDEAEEVPMHFAGTRQRIEDFLHKYKFTRLPSATDLDIYRGEGDTP